MSTLPKLVRDQIPEQIRRRGAVPLWHRAGPKQIARLLADKLVEEAGELQQAVRKHVPDTPVALELLQELADVQEVLQELVAVLAIDQDQLAEVRARKRQQAGGFADRVVLREVVDQEPT